MKQIIKKEVEVNRKHNDRIFNFQKAHSSSTLKTTKGGGVKILKSKLSMTRRVTTTTHLFQSHLLATSNRRRQSPPTNHKHPNTVGIENSVIATYLGEDATYYCDATHTGRNDTNVSLSPAVAITTSITCSDKME